MEDLEKAKWYLEREIKELKGVETDGINEKLLNQHVKNIAHLKGHDTE